MSIPNANGPPQIMTDCFVSFSVVKLYTCVHELGLDSAGQCTVPLFKSSLTLMKNSSLRTKIENVTGQWTLWTGPDKPVHLQKE